MNTMSIIVAIDADHGIGKNGQLPWTIPGDMAHFKEITTAPSSVGGKNVVIMGRKTWESIPLKFRPLAGRVNIVLTHNKKYPVPEGVFVSDSLTAALSLVAHDQSRAWGTIYVIGGRQVFAEALSDMRCTRLYVTHIAGRFSCDTFFPVFAATFSQTARSVAQRSVDGVEYYFAEYTRKNGA